MWHATVNDDCSLLSLNGEWPQEISCHRPKSREEELASFECFINCERQSHKDVEAKSHKCGEKVTQMWNKSYTNMEANSQRCGGSQQRCGGQVTKMWRPSHKTVPTTTACEEKGEP